MFRSAGTRIITSHHWQRCRHFSSSRLDPIVQKYATQLAKHQPCFSMASSNIHILYEPSAFYRCLLDMIKRAEKRIFLSSLYVGSEDRELVETLRNALREKPALHVRLNLDLNRSTRPGSDSTAHLLVPLLDEFPLRVHVSLFRSPKLKGLMAKLVPPRFNEGWGTWHPKIYGVDDEVMLSGANLNTSYFTNRQDRYIHFSEQPHLAQYCFTFLEAAAGFSHQLFPPRPTTEEYGLYWGKAVHPHHIESKAHRILSTFQQDNTPTSTPTLPPCMWQSPQHDTLVFPLIQAGQFGIREEERAMNALFNELSSSKSSQSGGPLIDLTSGYFGLYKNYRDLVLKSEASCRIIAASPKANGFYGSRGVSGRIPEGYTLLEQRFMKAVHSAGRDWDPSQTNGVQLTEWEREGWTYHAKGMWLRPSPEADPIMSLFGSTNLNSRSSNIDTELSFMLITSSSSVGRQLRKEVDGIREYAQPWRGAERTVRLGTKALVSIVGGML